MKKREAVSILMLSPFYFRADDRKNTPVLRLGMVKDLIKASQQS